MPRHFLIPVVLLALVIANPVSAADKPPLLSVLEVSGAFIIQYQVLILAVCYALSWVADVPPPLRATKRTDCPQWLSGPTTGLCEYLVFSVAVAMEVSGVMIAMISWTLIKVHVHWNLFVKEQKNNNTEHNKTTEPEAGQAQPIEGVKLRYVALLCSLMSLFLAMLVGLYAQKGWPGRIEILRVSFGAFIIVAPLVGFARFIKWRRERTCQRQFPGVVAS
jgi:hypothetical protein